MWEDDYFEGSALTAAAASAAAAAALHRLILQSVFSPAVDLPCLVQGSNCLFISEQPSGLSRVPVGKFRSAYSEGEVEFCVMPNGADFK